MRGNANDDGTYTIRLYQRHKKILEGSLEFPKLEPTDWENGLVSN